MTREEAREILESDLENEIFERTEYRTKLLEAKKMAIEALSEPTKTEPTRMEFPNTFDEYANEYGFKDDKEIYTNGSELIPVFRVKQWLEHINKPTQIIDKSNFDEKQYKADIDTAYECGRARPKAKWIRVDERLPEEGGDYLVTESFDLFVKEPTIEVHKNFYCILSKKWLYDNDNVVAWMPLPEPYNAEMESDSDA